MSSKDLKTVDPKMDAIFGMFVALYVCGWWLYGWPADGLRVVAVWVACGWWLSEWPAGGGYMGGLRVVAVRVACGWWLYGWPAGSGCTGGLNTNGKVGLATQDCPKVPKMTA